MLWIEAAFSACLAWHWSDHHWQCNWRVAWTSSRMYAGKRWTSQATIVTRAYDKRHFFGNYHNFITSNFRKVVRQHTEVMEGNIIWVLLEIYLAFQQWKNFENPLRIDKVTAMSLGTTFLDTVYISGGEMSEGTAKCRSIQPCVVASKSRRHESTAVQAPHRMTPS